MASLPVQRGSREVAANLLFLCHRVPYPPDKGDKIRSYHWLRALAGRYRVYLAAFVDDPADWQHAQHVRDLCADACLVGLGSGRAKLRSLPALVTQASLSESYYRDGRVAAWVEQLLDSVRIDRIVVYSSAMAQYVCCEACSALPRIIDFVDVDSAKWQQYADARRGVMAWLYRREARCLLAYDADVARHFDASLFVSRQEAAFFQRLAGLPRRPHALSNGVDHGYFAPDADRPSPYPSGVRAVVFTGAMDYWANVDAVRWFVRQAWPRIRADWPDARFYIVGARPHASVRGLSGDGVHVTGRVEDVRPYLQHALAVVAPMRIARGIQNKVLEGMAMGRPVIVSEQALEGIEAEPGRDLLLARTAEEYVARLGDVLRGLCPDVGLRARSRVLERYDWGAVTSRFLDLVASAKPGMPQVGSLGLGQVQSRVPADRLADRVDESSAASD